MTRTGRVVVAELAAELEDDLRQALGDARDRARPVMSDELLAQLARAGVQSERIEAMRAARDEGGAR